MKTILKKLADGDFRSIGKSNEVVKTVLANPKLFPDVFSGLLESDPIVRMRAADALEKITAEKPELLQKFKKPMLDRVAHIEQQEVQWHVAQMIPRLQLSKSDMIKVRKILDTYLKSTLSNIVRVMSLQALADLASQGKLDTVSVTRGIEQYTDMVNTPSVRARSKKLLKQLGKK
ncbi:MAG: hypothetical protein HY036_09285 [Nitrospirae bacterium]|nr:hypothetical protein [Nitrospirota bacterium]